MAKEREKEIIDQIQAILRTSSTVAELAESFLHNRPSSGDQSGDRDEIVQELSGFDRLRGQHDVLNRIVEAYGHFSAHILFEGGFFSNRQIHNMLLSAEQMDSRIDDSITACELTGNAPVSVNVKSVLVARDTMMYLSQAPVYLESSQLTELQMLCLNVPEAITDVMRVMGQRPFFRAAHGDDRPYLQAFVRVLYALLERDLPATRGGGGVAGSETRALIAGILSAFYQEYLSFPSEDYLIDLVNRSI
jgi:hypothetical protein